MINKMLGEKIRGFSSVALAVVLALFVGCAESKTVEQSINRLKKSTVVFGSYIPGNITIMRAMGTFNPVTFSQITQCKKLVEDFHKHARHGLLCSEKKRLVGGVVFDDANFCAGIDRVSSIISRKPPPKGTDYFKLRNELEQLTQGALYLISQSSGCRDCARAIAIEEMNRNQGLTSFGDPIEEQPVQNDAPRLSRFGDPLLEPEPGATKTFDQMWSETPTPAETAKPPKKTTFEEDWNATPTTGDR